VPSPSSSHLDAALFDLDGTIWDSLPGIAACLAHALDAVGVSVPDDQTLAANIGPPLLEMLAHFGVPADRLEEAKVAYRDRYQRLGEFECTLYPGAPELLSDLRAAGLRLATATSKGVEPTLRMLDHFGIAPHFEVVGAASMDASAHLKVDVITAALNGLDTAERIDRARVVMIGDRHYDIDGGHAHGLGTIGVTWGYGGSDELRTSGAAVLVESFDELRAVLLDGASADA
jgi:phosphoglycolate phosphatase